MGACRALGSQHQCQATIPGSPLRSPAQTGRVEGEIAVSLLVCQSEGRRQLARVMLVVVNYQGKQTGANQAWSKGQQVFESS